MSETQPLLAGGLPLPAGAILQDHPIFLRAAHSPWNWLNQNVLCYLRGAVLAYVIAVFGMTTHFKLDKHDEHSDWRLMFQFSTITWIIIVAYHVLVFSWTLTHLHWPEVDPNDQTWEAKVLRLMQPPQQRSGYSRGRFYFSLFYTLVHVYSFMLIIIYWTVLVPNGHGHLPKRPGAPDTPSLGDDFLDDILAEGWFKAFSVFNIYTFPAFLGFFEIFFLNAITRQVPVPSHLFATQFFAALYLGWAAIGKLITGHNPFFWMDEKLTGSREAVAVYCVGFVALAGGCFSFMYGLISMRDSMVERGADVAEIITAVRDEAPRRRQ